MIARIAKGIGKGLLWLLITLSLIIAILPYFLDRLYYEGPTSLHYDGAHFANPDEGQGDWPQEVHGTRSSARGRLSYMRGAMFGDDRPKWPETVAVAKAKPKELPPLKPGEMRATWVGHATVLIETPGFTMLTDPIWSDVAGLWGRIGPRRVAEPGIVFDDLPKIDLVVVSHNHYDHMDVETLKRLVQRDKPAIVTSLGNDKVIDLAGVQALDWGKSAKVGAATVTVTRNHHWGSRWGSDRNRALWSSFIVDTPSGSVFFAGDTGYGDGLWPAEAAKSAAGPVRLAIIPIGAFRFQPGQMWAGSHIGPHHAVKVFEGLGASTGLPIHWGTFRLSWEAYDTPPKMLAEEMKCAGLDPARYARHEIGVPFLVPETTAQARNPNPVCDKSAIAALP